jgi:quinol monooxygenase YgiN
MSKKFPAPEEVFWIYEVAINPGKTEDFVSLARDLMATMEDEPGTVEYRYSLNADKSICHIYERYRDSDGLIAHADNFGRAFSERFTETCSPSRFSVYGAPDDRVRSILDQYGAAFLSNIIRPSGS